MGQVRPFQREDIPRIIELNVKLFPGSASLSRETQEYIFNEICFHNPWNEPEITSLVYEESNGHIAGFLGIVPRHMMMNGKTIRIAVSQHLMVDHVPVASMQLFRKLISGPQDLTIADMAADITRKMWERLGGSTSLLYSTYWKKPLRPTTFALSYLNRGTIESPTFNLFKPLTLGVDALMGQIPHRAFQHEAPPGDREELSIETILSSLPKFTSGYDLVPAYTKDSLTWLFDILKRERRFGLFRKQAVKGKDGEIIGWFIYNLMPKGKSSLLQIAATRQSMATVIRHLFYDAWENGSIEVWGRLDPWYMKEYTDQFCFFTPGSNWALLHSPHPELIRTINEGKTFLSRLEGDLWFF